MILFIMLSPRGLNRLGCSSSDASDIEQNAEAIKDSTLMPKDNPFCGMETLLC
ncbi:hypothetical protein [Candidatus Williamhamiltonella defendens]|uniref:hypothetical protein n=1 Tax=Candidatus Williamhamiltonella defendens TaxID=138072 RepID=UPI001651A98C|nr:hypothetical protein [Candidatus Hamiltonella defensa]